MFAELTSDELNNLIDVMAAANEKCYKLAMFVTDYDSLWRQVNRVHRDVCDVMYDVAQETLRRLPMFDKLTDKELHVLKRIICKASEDVYYAALWALECDRPEAFGLRDVHAEIAHLHADVAAVVMRRAYAYKVFMSPQAV